MATTKARRQHDTGTLFQRSDGRWIGRYRDGYTETGKPRFRTVSDLDEKKCRSKLNTAVRNRNRADQETSLNPRITVKQWSDKWLPLRQERVRPKTYSTDASCVKQGIVPTIGHRKLAELTPEDIRRMDRAVEKKGLSDATIKRTRSTLTLMLKAAAVEGYTVPPRLFMMDTPPDGKSDRMDIPVLDAIKLLEAAEPDPRRSRWIAALLNGVRQGEALGLTWDRVDLDRGLINISWQLQEIPSEHGCDGDCKRKRAAFCYARRFRVPKNHESIHLDGRWHLTKPKTKAGDRIIPLVPMMVDALREWQLVAPHSPHNLVWPEQGGAPLDVKDDRLAFEELQTKAEVRHPGGRFFQVHENRHSTATILMALGVDTQVIIAIMGHASILSTRKYQHADLELMRTALGGVAERLQLSA